MFNSSVDCELFYCFHGIIELIHSICILKSVIECNGYAFSLVYHEKVAVFDLEKVFEIYDEF